MGQFHCLCVNILSAASVGVSGVEHFQASSVVKSYLVSMFYSLLKTFLQLISEQYRGYI